MNKTEALSALSGLAQESRLDIYRLLIESGPEGLAASKIGEKLGIPSSSLSFHLKELFHAKLVTSRTESRFVIYVANFKTMNCLLQYLSENCCDGNPCLSIGATTYPEQESALK